MGGSCFVAAGGVDGGEDKKHKGEGVGGVRGVERRCNLQGAAMMSVWREPRAR